MTQDMWMKAAHRNVDATTESANYHRRQMAASERAVYFLGGALTAWILVIIFFLMAL